MPDVSALLQAGWLQSFKTMFVSIVLEAFPFILIGVIISALLQSFVSEQTIRRFVPRHPVLGILYACVIGILFPICECGMIPVMRRLLRKGMPLYIAIVFIVAGPILNPVVFASTYMAFRSQPEIAYARMGLAFCCAVVIGLLVYRFARSNPLRPERPSDSSRVHAHDHDHDHGHRGGHSHGGKLAGVFAHMSDEFFEMGKYLIFGALLASAIQTVLSREWLTSIGTGDISSHLFMAAFAYVLSLCSTSDAFVASSFLSTFSIGSLLTFLVFGPILDMKSTLMLTAIFRGRFVLALSLLIIVTVLSAAMIAERILPL